MQWKCGNWTNNLGGKKSNLQDFDKFKNYISCLNSLTTSISVKILTFKTKYKKISLGKIANLKHETFCKSYKRGGLKNVNLFEKFLLCNAHEWKEYLITTFINEQ